MCVDILCAAVPDDFLAMEKVTVVRTRQREGLLRARVLGAQVATGEVRGVILLALCIATAHWHEKK
jgi:hypothetical protein